MTDQYIGKVLAEKYRIDSLLSESESGNLYHGTHLLMEKPVVVKVLPAALAADEAMVKSFADEARTVSRLTHPNVLNVNDFGTDQDSGPFIVYEDITGETLKESIARNGKFSLQKANRIVKEIASVLSAAHANGVVHQNLSSQNVILQPPAAKIMGFGTPTFDINDLDYPIGKIEYLAPEQCTLAGKTDQRTDVFALGVILFEMLAGQVPLTAGNGTDLLEKQINEPPPPINAFRRDLPNEVDDILLKALAKNPEIRYRNADELAAELDQVSSMAGDVAEEETFVAARPMIPANVAVKPEPPQNNLWKTAFIVLAGISLLGSAFIYLTNAGKQTNPSTQVQTDANGMPVQPAPPPTGSMEQTLSNMDTFNPNYGNTNAAPMTDTGGGVSNPYWENGGRPPGAPPVTGYGDPLPMTPGNTGPTVYMGPPDSNRSIFMQDGNEYILVPKGNSNTASNVNTQPKKNSNTNTAPANTTVKPTPAANTSTPPQVKPTPTPKPADTKPKTEPTKPPTTEKRQVSGRQQDTDRF